MLHALKMTVAATGVNKTTGAKEGATTTAVYDLDGFAQTSKDSANMHTTVNAVGYYNEVLGTNLSVPDKYLTTNETFIDKTACIGSAAKSSDNSATSVLFTIPESGFVEVRFTFWLDGWDSFCYDVCQRQNFSIDMGFTTQAAESVLVTATAATGKASA